MPARSLSGFAKLATVTAAVSLLLVALGGAVRATDSGLACPTWPGCFSAGDFVPAPQLNVWLEHSHRLLAGVVGVLAGAQLLWAAMRYRHRADVLWPAVGAFLLVLAQAALGALVVWRLLRTELVTAHLGMGMVVVAFLLYAAVNATLPAPAPGSLSDRDRRLARASALVAAATLLQILVGGHVTGIAAGLAFVGDEFPFLGLASFAPLASDQQWYNAAHRVLAVVLTAAVMMLLAGARRAGRGGWLLRLPQIATALVVVQILLGIANLATGLSPVTVIPHLAVASWIWAALVLNTVLAYRLPAARGPRGKPANSTTLPVAA